eukprot:CAMPEP_0194026388 /NCGR_PEP_ID=MMETSP0009_2-20130614/706_1 /TAXON_ID=210454 /ORGANISM="Grammatophora oceanica, Strain CCMP 410" /LENGTH=764 /DNA_ID=CAMNT_0038665057 /DNA_START=476 /DNA_END=2770 /DNA_ORIENTATION=-
MVRLSLIAFLCFAACEVSNGFVAPGGSKRAIVASGSKFAVGKESCDPSKARNMRLNSTFRLKQERIGALSMVSTLLEDFGDESLDSFSPGLDSDSTMDLAQKFMELSQQVHLSRPASLSKEGLSKIHRDILRRTHGRQRFVTGKDPLLITVEESATKKWLQSTATNTHLLVNGTAVSNSLASFDRFQWIDEPERQELVDRYAMVSMELIGEIYLKKPGYINVLPSTSAGASAARSEDKTHSFFQNSILYDQLGLGEKKEVRSSDRMWVTGFSLASKQGFMHSVDVETGRINSVDKRTSRSILWPNESNSVPRNLVKNNDRKGEAKQEDTSLDDALLVSDGFLVPGKDKGGIYVVKNPGNPETEWNVCLTGGTSASQEDYGWFYHRAVWVDLTGDGRKSILTARTKMSSMLNGDEAGTTKAQLVWLELPEPHHYCDVTGSPLEEDGSLFDPLHARHLPWKSHVLDEGPDVMFTVADLDTEDDTVEVIASQFFSRKVTLHSIQRGPEPKVVLRRTLDDNCGAAFGAVLAQLDGDCPVTTGSSAHPIVVDGGSTVETRKPGDTFSHVLVTSHECSFSEDVTKSSRRHEQPARNGLDDLSYTPEICDLDGGSLFAFRVPEGKDAWKTEPWLRTTVASGFTVRGQLGNMINPGAPGFVYTFHPKRNGAKSGQRPLIAIAGDCSESAYILRPMDNDNSITHQDPSARYKLMCEIECGGTVGSIGVGYDDFVHANQEHDYAKLYIPCFEKDKVLVFAMGSGEDEYGDSDGF